MHGRCSQLAISRINSPENEESAHCDHHAGAAVGPVRELARFRVGHLSGDGDNAPDEHPHEPPLFLALVGAQAREPGAHTRKLLLLRTMHD